MSAEADTYPLDAPEKADLIDGSIGERSPFHETFGYYAHGVGPETAVLPTRWKSRCVPVQNANTHGVLALCLSSVDLAISKLAAGREKDLACFPTGRLAGPSGVRGRAASVGRSAVGTPRCRAGWQ